MDAWAQRPLCGGPWLLPSSLLQEPEGKGGLPVLRHPPRRLLLLLSLLLFSFSTLGKLK